jgi:hypothetical protein
MAGGAESPRIFMGTNPLSEDGRAHSVTGPILKKYSYNGKKDAYR